MTIAAAFLYRDGVLLCADTELSGWAMTLHEPKVTHFQCPGGVVGMTYAGNRAFALSTIQKCQRKLEHTPPDETMGQIEKIIDKEYRRTVLSHPGRATDGSLVYSLLISVCSGSDVRLYVTEQVTMRQVSEYECVGIGDALAHYLVRPDYTAEMGERRVLELATFMLACVKGSVPGCGGLSQFLAIRKDGTVKTFFAGAGSSLRTNTEWLERPFEGVAEPVFHAGKRVLDVAVDEKGQIKRNADGKPIAVPATVRKLSDVLLMFMLNGNRSNKYRQRTDARFVDEKGKDRKLDLDAVSAYVNSVPDDGA